MTLLSSMLYCRIGLHRWISHRKPENGVPYRSLKPLVNDYGRATEPDEGCRQRDGPRVAADERVPVITTTTRPKARSPTRRPRTLTTAQLLHDDQHTAHDR
jgi:hypothetical protein